MTVRPLRVGIAGAGWVSPHHLRAWGQLRDRATVVAIADPFPGAAAARAAEFGIPAAHDSVEAMLDATPLDALDVATPRETHGPISLLAARRGLAILCQKPLAPTLADAESLVSEVSRIGGVRLMVHENWRFRPHYRLIASWLREGLVGDVQMVVLETVTSGLLPDATGALPALVRQPMLATLDRMLVMEVLIHHVDTLRFLVGELELTRAALKKRCDAIRGEDGAILVLRGASGVSAKIIGDFMAPGYPPEQSDALVIRGTLGSIRLHGSQLTLRGTESRSVTLDLAANYAESYRGAIAHFLDRLADGGPFETGPEDNLRTLRLVEAAYASE